MELERDRLPEAAALLTEALEGFEFADDGRGVAQCLEAVATVAARRSAFRPAARLLGAAAALRDRLVAPLPEEDREAHAAAVRQVRRALGAATADGLDREGRALPQAAAFAIARDVLAGPGVPAPGGPLTPRETEVARLVRRGCTNRQIGRQLGISEKTIEVHVHNIIGKLGASSRAEIAAWVATRDEDPGA